LPADQAQDQTGNHQVWLPEPCHEIRQLLKDAAFSLFIGAQVIQHSSITIFLFRAIVRTAMITDQEYSSTGLDVLTDLCKQLDNALAGYEMLAPALVLIGPSGAGKTSVGAEIAQRQNLTHLDMDNIIESSLKLKISDIFAAYDEAGFRKLENHLLDACVACSGRVTNQDKVKTVISAGGGTPVFPGNFEKLRHLGTVVALTASPDSLLQRLSGKEKRPMLEKTATEGPQREALESLLAARKAIYEQAAFTVDTTELSIAEVASLIEQKLCQ
jgi:shikimate kinase